jgi:hypothetical protein
LSHERRTTSFSAAAGAAIVGRGQEVWQRLKDLWQDRNDVWKRLNDVFQRHHDVLKLFLKTQKSGKSAEKQVFELKRPGPD